MPPIPKKPERGSLERNAMSVEPTSLMQRGVLTDTLSHSPGPYGVLKRHLEDMDAIIEFGMAIEDLMWRGDFMETQRRAFDVLPREAVLDAVRGADASDAGQRHLLEQVSKRSEHQDVRQAALEALSKE